MSRLDLRLNTWPEQAHAYQSPGEYMFGADMLVAPVTRPVEGSVETVSIWLPPGRWYDNNRGEVIDGGRTIVRDYALDEVPVFVRAGAVLPLNPPSVRKLQAMDNSQLVLRVFPGGKARTRVYTDSGDSEGYREGDRAESTVDCGQRAACRPCVAAIGNTSRVLGWRLHRARSPAFKAFR